MARKKKATPAQKGKYTKGLGKNMATGVSGNVGGTTFKSGPSTNIAQARALMAQKGKVNATGRNRFAVGAGVLNQSVGAGGLTKRGKITKAQAVAARQSAKTILAGRKTAKGVLGSSES